MGARQPGGCQAHEPAARSRGLALRPPAGVLTLTHPLTTREPRLPFPPSHCAATFKKLARGKVIISPTMHAIEKAYLDLGLLNGRPGMQPDRRIPKAACAAVKKDLPRLVAKAVRPLCRGAVPSRVCLPLVLPLKRAHAPLCLPLQKDVAADAGCWLVYSTKDVKSPLKKMVYVVDFDMGKTPTKSKVKAQADEQFSQNQAPPCKQRPDEAGAKLVCF